MAKIMYDPIKCTFTDILRVDDYTLTNGKATISDSYKLKESDVVCEYIKKICTYYDKLTYSLFRFTFLVFRLKRHGLQL